ncbi:DUF2062 domain-containing protein [Pseudaestuariivita atlantica]|uniref:DNA-directed RNA polymerase subunit omega n=1 Tax=Pseudaestuariivita atlantica TaxID=1317121 RepID=A0A0L1JSC2_9RHOB|nr:DUF2062 domain-containing protein [Pseudaestuariivita atlantica]KNG94655.1 DNA-directed RNA polymerase subunit omega [Pseudaestuariivita atlantica]
MVFKRRDRKSWGRWALELIWPKGGWTRAAQYVKHRLRRLPDSPERISRGIWAGLFTTFTPFYGLHFIVAGAIAMVMRGNILAAMLATFFGNPLTYVPIGVISLHTGYALLGIRPEDRIDGSIGRKFVKAGEDLWHNITAPFTDATADWTALGVFYQEVFFPYLIGGILPGIVVATIGYYLSIPVIRAYKKRRKGLLKEKFEALRERRAAAKAEAEAAKAKAEGERSDR